MDRKFCRQTTRDGAAVPLLGLLALAITGAGLLVAVPELLTLVRAIAVPVALSSL